MSPHELPVLIVGIESKPSCFPTSQNNFVLDYLENTRNFELRVRGLCYLLNSTHCTVNKKSNKSLVSVRVGVAAPLKLNKVISPSKNLYSGLLVESYHSDSSS